MNIEIGDAGIHLHPLSVYFKSFNMAFGSLANCFQS